MIPISMKMKKIAVVLLSVLILLVNFSVPAKAEEIVLSTNQTKYRMNDPILVTASGGVWVGAYKYGEDPSVEQGRYFYRFDVNGETQNLYNGQMGNRGTSFIATIPKSLGRRDIFLFGDEGYDNVLAKVTIQIVTTIGESSLSTKSVHPFGSDVYIQAYSNERDAWVGVYSGSYSLVDDLKALTPVHRWYVCHRNNEGDYVSGLEIGDYTVALYKENGMVDKLVHFYVGSSDEILATDMQTYYLDSPVLVTTTDYFENGWVGLYEKGAGYDPANGGVVPIYQYELTEEQPQEQNILEGTANRAEDYKAGEYTVVLFADETYENSIASKDITVIDSVAPSLSTDAEKYRMNDPIWVSAKGGVWVGAYRVGEDPADKKDQFFYRFDVDGETHNIYSGEVGYRPGTFVATIPHSRGKRDIILFGDEGYEKILGRVTVQIVSTIGDSVLSTEERYSSDDNVFVDVYSNQRDAWVGIYKGQYDENTRFDKIEPYEKWFVCHRDNKGVDLGKLGEGYYTAVLYQNSGYTIDLITGFKVGNDENMLVTDKDIYELNEPINVTTNCLNSNAWIGLYLREDWAKLKDNNPLPVYQYTLSDEQPETRNILAGTANRPDDYVPGSYVVALFGSSGTDRVLKTKEITINESTIPADIVYTKVTCTGYGYVKVFTYNGSSYYELQEPLGHDFGEWTYDPEVRAHMHSCKRCGISEHAECIFDDGELIQVPTISQPGMKKYTCSICGGTYTEEVAYQGIQYERIFGDNRYATAFKTADELKKVLGIEKFEAIVIASGLNFADALSGAYFANKVNAPILLVNDSADKIAMTKDYVKANLAKDGMVYILGGPRAVSSKYETELSRYKVKRLAGNTRYETNLAILEEAQVASENILICTGDSFADSLSASSIERPILLVKDKLNDKQLKFLKEHNKSRYYIIGGEKAVSTEVENQIRSIRSYRRLAGANRYETSVLIAQEFFKKPSLAVMAYGKEFPDGLCGGPLASALDVPIILAEESRKEEASQYCHNNYVSHGIVLGGQVRLSDKAVEYILTDEQEVVVKNEYRIIYMLDGGVNNINNPLKYKTRTSVKLYDPTKVGCLFGGWCIDEECDLPFRGFTETTTGDVTLYAKWIPEPLNVTVDGNANMIWSWWYSPQAFSHEDKLYWGFADNNGYSGIAEYDKTTGKTRKTFLKKVEKVDDHNGVGITVMDDGTILCAFAGGHNTDRLIHIRLSNEPYNVERFDREIILESAENTCYGQLLHYDGKIFLFYRLSNKRWRYRSSRDGINWSDEVVLVNADEQYYCKFVETTQKGLFRVVMYANPAGTDTNIRMGFFDPDRGVLLNSDAKTELGTSRVSFSSFDIIIPTPGTMTQRMFDVAVTDPDKPRILTAEFVNTTSSLDSIYKLYDSGKTTVICHGGHPLWNPKYQLGASFMGNDQIVVGRNESDTDYIELYSIGADGSVNLAKSIYSEDTNNYSVRNGRPIADINGKAILWHRGYYDEAVYTRFDTESMIYYLDN